MERAEHIRQDHIMVQEEQRMDNVRSAIANGTRDREERVVADLRRDYKKMSRGFGGERNGERR